MFIWKMRKMRMIRNDDDDSHPVIEKRINSDDDAGEDDKIPFY